MLDVLSNQLIVLGTIVGAIAALPALIQFLIERRKRRERLDLALDDEATPRTPVRLVGLDAVLRDIADLVDRAKDHDHYAQLYLGNEILIVGQAQTGRRSLARWIAQQAQLDRIITVHNPRFSEALAAAKRLVRASHDEKLMLLLPNIDEVFDSPQATDQEEEIQAELDALIEAVASRPNVLVVGTAKALTEGDDLDDIFGSKIMLPGAPPVTPRPTRPAGDFLALLGAVARDELDRAAREGFAFEGFSCEDAQHVILARVGNPAEIQDIVEAARTTAIHLKRTGAARELCITRDVLHKAVRRVMGFAGPITQA